MKEADLEGRTYKAVDLYDELHWNTFTCHKCGQNARFIMGDPPYFRHFKYNSNCPESVKEGYASKAAETQLFLSNILHNADRMESSQNFNQKYALTYVTYGDHFAKWTFFKENYCLKPVLLMKFIYEKAFHKKVEPHTLFDSLSKNIYKTQSSDKGDSCQIGKHQVFRFPYYDSKSKTSQSVYYFFNARNSPTKMREFWYYPLREDIVQTLAETIMIFPEDLFVPYRNNPVAIQGDDGYYYCISGVYEKVEGAEDAVRAVRTYDGKDRIFIQPGFILPIHLSEDASMLEEVKTVQPLKVITSSRSWSKGYYWDDPFDES